MKKITQMKNRVAAKAAFALAAVAGSVPVYAIDTTEVQTAITAAETDGLAVGAMVVAAVAAFAVIGVIISVVRKL